MPKERIKLTQEEFAKQVSKRLVELFNNSKEFKTQSQIVSYLENEITGATLSPLFAGEHNISAYYLMKVIDALDGSADYVLFGKEKRPQLAEFRKIIEEAQPDLSIDDKEIKNIILKLGKLKTSDKSLFETIKLLIKENDQKKIDAIVNMIDLILGD